MENEKGNSVGDQEKHSKGEASDDVSLNSDIAGLCYFLIFAPLIYYRRKDSPFIQFHAKQANTLFLITIFFAILPGKLSWLLLLSLAMAVTGVLQANMGKWWRMPIVAELLDSGLSYDSTKTLGKKGIALFQRAFNLRKKQSEKDNTERVQLLEEALLKETRLRKQRMTELSDEQQKIIKAFSKICHSKEDEYSLTFQEGNRIVLLGGFSETGMEVFANKKFFSGSEHLETLSGKQITWEEAQEKVVEILQKIFPPRETNTEADSPTLEPA